MKKTFDIPAMNNLLDGLTSSPSSSSLSSVKRGRKPSAKEEEHVCTKIESSLYKKAKMISSIESIPIKDIINKGLEHIVSAYEAKKGVLEVSDRGKKGDLNDILS